MSKYFEIIVPAIFAVLMSIVHSIKAGKTKFLQITTEAIVSFILGWLTYYALQTYMHLNYEILCGACGLMGYFSPLVMKGAETLINTWFDTKIDDLKK